MANEQFNTTVNVIKVVGVGGGGGNAVNRMMESRIEGVEYIAVNTDLMVLNKSLANKRIAIGERITKGQGAGANPELGEKAADESIEEITAALQGADMVFITAGMGGGTGTGAAPIVAKIAKQLGILTVCIVTKPFNFEGKKRMAQAESGIKRLAEVTDSLIVIPNERLKLLTDKKITFLNAFYEADDILRKGVQSICELVTQEAEINVDFADVCAVMQGAGLAHMGVGSAKGKDKAEQAAKLAMSSPLLETNINGAKGIVINVTASPDIGLEEVDYAVAMITNEANPDATIIFGAAFDDSLEDEMRITLIATGFEGSKASDIRRPAATSADVRRPADQTADKPSAPVKEAEAGSEEDINNIIDMINRSRSDDKNLF
ncbi:MAG: cell division protein FtsZ [Clostridiales bacterium]|nr:cell division protein FtsZ [Clostridiales bacterium]